MSAQFYFHHKLLLRNQYLSFLLIISIFQFCFSAHASDTKQAFINANIIDVRTGELTKNAVIYVDRGKIAAIEQNSAAEDLSRGYVIIDVKGGFVVPGLWDSHIHLGDSVEESRENALRLLAKGITQTRDMGRSVKSLKSYKQAEQQGKLSGLPHVINAGPLIDGSMNTWYGDLQYVIEDEGTVANKLASIKRSGADFIKVYQDLSEPVYQKILIEADKLELDVHGHVPSRVGIEALVSGSQKTIEHLDISAFQTCSPNGRELYGKALNAKFGEGYSAYYQVMIAFWQSIDWQSCGQALRKFAERGGALNPSLIMETFDHKLVGEKVLKEMHNEDWLGKSWCMQQLAGVERADKRLRQQYLAEIKKALSKIKGYGVIILAGSDSPNYCNIAGDSLLWELHRLNEFGLTNLEVLQSATINPAKVFKMPESTEIRVGSAANFIVLNENPLATVKAYSALRGTYFDSRWRQAVGDKIIRNGIKSGI